MKALIQNTKVIDVQETEFEVHESLSWVDCDSSIEIGDTYDGSTFTPQVTPRTAEQELEYLRNARNSLLTETDWWASSDLTMTAEQTAYRQALRDITDTYSSLDEVVWPTKP